MSGDVEALADVLRAHLPKDRYDDGVNVGTYCSCGGWEGDYFADGEAGPFDDHLATVLAAHVQAARADDAARLAAVEALADEWERLRSEGTLTWASRYIADLRAALRAPNATPEEERPMSEHAAERDAGPVAARIISPDCDDLDHPACDGRMCSCHCHEGYPCGHEAIVRGCGGCDPSPGPCWRGECRAACYYPQACSERPAICPLCGKPAHDYRCGVTP